MNLIDVRIILALLFSCSSFLYLRDMLLQLYVLVGAFLQQLTKLLCLI